MKLRKCLVCSEGCEVEDGMSPTCLMCGEASWTTEESPDAKPAHDDMPLPKPVKGATMV